MTNNGKALIPVTLICGHALNFQSNHLPNRGTTLFCFGCQELRTVTEIRNEWSVRCKDCRYRRGFGMAEVTCTVSATKHALKRGHRVYVLRGNTVVETVGNQNAQLELT